MKEIEKFERERKAELERLRREEELRIKREEEKRRKEEEVINCFIINSLTLYYNYYYN